MDFAEFAELLALRIGIQPRNSPAEPDTRLVEDWEIDSFQLLQLVVVVEDLAATDCAGREVPTMVTLEDAFRYYEAVLATAG